MTSLMTALFTGVVFVGVPAIATAEDVPPAMPVAATQPPGSPPLVAGPAYGPPPAAAPLFGDRYYRSPGLAAALSLQPLPIDFGNLYAENLGWGIAYTAIETSLLAPMMWMTGAHMDHGAGNDRNWSGMETGAMMGLVSGYVVVKIVAGVHAGYAARQFNESYAPRGMALIAPAREGAMLVWSGSL